MLAELPVPGPRLATIDLERQGVDQERAALVKLNVVRAAILERHSVQKRAALDFEGRQRSVSKSAHAPLEGVRDELDPLGPEHLVGQLRIGSFAGNFLVANQQASLYQIVVEPTGKKLIVMFPVNLVYLPPQLTVIGIHKSGGVAERNSREGMDIHALRFLTQTPSRNWRIQDFKKNDELRRPASKT